MRCTIPDKNFVHVDHKVSIPEMKVEEGNGRRYYVTPEGNHYPSITTLLGCESRSGIERWRNQIGEEKADKISKKAALRGTRMHDLIEHYLLNDNYSVGTPSGVMYFFNSVKEELNKIDNIFALEIPLYSNGIELAGRVDAIAEFNGVPSIIDFKTSRKKKKKAYVKNYFMQTSFYSYALQELTGIKVTNLVIIISNEDGSCTVFQDNRKNHLPDLFKVREKYRKELEYKDVVCN